MVTIEQLIAYIERRIAEGRLAGDSAGLRKIQSAAGLLMDAANHADDKDTATRLKLLAAKAANAQEAITE